MQELDGSGAVVTRYSQTLMSADEPLAIFRSGSTSFYNADGIGSITSLANTSGALAQTYTFDSFGILTASSGSITNQFRFTAREYDQESPLNFYRSRYLDSTSGRFISEDPIRFEGGANFYVYVDNNPQNQIDPSGLLGKYKCTFFGGCSKVSPSRPNLPQADPPANPNPDPVNNEYQAYRACTGLDLWKNVNIKGCSVPIIDPNKPSPFGPQDPPLPLGNLENDIATSTAKKCLQKYPLAALDPRFGDIAPADPY